jgi:hypothetical protein
MRKRGEEMIIDEKLKTDMEITAKKMKRLDSLNQIIIASKIDALYERQMVDEAEKKRLSKTRGRSRCV